MRTDKTPATHPYRIGAVSSQTGIPVTTLRIWESRYGAFAPIKTDGGHRLYAAEDMHKAQLFKQLSAQGHAISAIANLDVAGLRGLLQGSPATALAALSGPADRAGLGDAPRTALALAVVGQTLATRLASGAFGLALPRHAITLTDRFADLAALEDAGLQPAAELLLIQASTLHEREAEQIRQWRLRHPALAVIVVYHYAPERLLQGLRRDGLLLRREPVTDYELAELMQSVLARPASAMPSPPQAIPARKYSNAMLARVGALPNQMRCECPRHVAEIVSQLANFEVYSQECLNKSPQDAQLHAYLAATAGTARALFERALEQVALHEGIALEALPG